MAPSPSSLAHFPSLCLEAIFKYVPLEDLLRSVGLVCTSWHTSRHTELMRRRRLVIVRDEKILDKPYNVMHCTYETQFIRHVRRDDGSVWLTLESTDRIKLDSVVVPESVLTTPLTTSLMVMSNISHLVLMFGNVSNSTLVQMNRLIGHLADVLVNLELTFSFTTINESEFVNNITNLFVCLNRLQSLKHLTLGLYCPFPIRTELSLLSRLTTLTYTVYGIDSLDWILPSLGHYGANIGAIKFHILVKVTRLLQLDHRLNGKFTALSLSVQDNDNLRLFCGRFSSLNSLQLNVCSIPMTMLARCLSQLAQLVHLDLKFISFPEAEEAQADDDEVEQPAQQQIAQIPSVRLLTLYISTNSHLDTEKLFIPEMLPNLQVLHLKHDIKQCPNCEIDPRNGMMNYSFEHSSPELALRLVRCRRLTRRPFRACANLHTIALEPFYYCGNVTMITVNEL